MDARRLLSGNFSFADLHPGVLLVIVFLLAYPGFASDFFVFQIGAYTLILGTIALSLMMLGG